MSEVPFLAIVGGGITGPALALSLKKHHGISSTIYELQPKYDVRGVNITLAPNAVRVLQHVGVYDEVRKHGYTYEDLNLSNAKSQVLGTLCQGSPKHYNFACLRVHRAIVQKALLDEAAAQGIPVIFGKKLVGLREDNDAVELEFADGTTTKASFVVGADGVHSRVRDAIMHTKTGYSGFMGIIGMGIKRESLHESINKIALPNFVFGKKGFVALMPSSHDGTVVDFFSTMPYPTQSREEWNKLAKHKTEVQKILQERFGNEWPQFICDITRDLDKEGLILIPFYEVPPLNRWTSVQQRVILAGDSAHAFTPQGGQGAAMGLEDAETLSHTFSHPQFASDYKRLLTIWQDHRKDRLILVKNLADLSGRLRTPDSALVQFAKEWVMWANMKWTGPMGNMKWLNGYNAEDVLKLY
ncbi:kynurenine 3-monooxygenase [Paecilomyces variotii No. 5]|uniref:Kynurenine 3-monooxygenase n=1 Tax=Byssochlamys spectabilis (strain No. 5 / NBRC 109023) TaxID=1356009 RepID=V5FFF4_BYSSN|nr:kynurenine 3-monooxygenase [Paecilomyces variotii No. 5]